MLVKLRIYGPDLKAMIAAELRRRLGVEVDEGGVTLVFDINGDKDGRVCADVAADLPERGAE